MSNAKTRVHKPAVVIAEATHEKITAHCKRRGISRAQTYVDLAAGKYEAVKDGNKTLIVVASADRYYANLPKAEFGSRGRFGRAVPGAVPAVPAIT
jgi:hypothetical protein